MNDRTLTPAEFVALDADIRDYGYAIIQTRIERVPARYRNVHCAEPDGCHARASLVTLAVATVTKEGPGAAGLRFARRYDGQPARIPVCDDHRAHASHDLYYALTKRERPSGIRAFDVPGQYLSWT